MSPDTSRAARSNGRSLCSRWPTSGHTHDWVFGGQLCRRFCVTPTIAHATGCARCAYGSRRPGGHPGAHPSPGRHGCAEVSWACHVRWAFSGQGRAEVSWACHVHRACSTAQRPPARRRRHPGKITKATQHHRHQNQPSTGFCMCCHWTCACSNIDLWLSGCRSGRQCCHQQARLAQQSGCDQSPQRRRPRRRSNASRSSQPSSRCPRRRPAGQLRLQLHQWRQRCPSCRCQRRLQCCRCSWAPRPASLRVRVQPSVPGCCTCPHDHFTVSTGGWHACMQSHSMSTAGVSTSLAISATAKQVPVLRGCWRRSIAQQPAAGSTQWSHAPSAPAKSGRTRRPATWWPQLERSILRPWHCRMASCRCAEGAEQPASLLIDGGGRRANAHC